MVDSDIKGIVMDFKGLINSVSEQCGDEATDELITAFRAVLKDLFPSKYFVLYEEGHSDAVLIFDSEKKRDKWLLTNCPQSCSTRQINISEFNEYSCSEWDNPNDYEIIPSGELAFRLMNVSNLP